MTDLITADVDAVFIHVTTDVHLEIAVQFAQALDLSPNKSSEDSSRTTHRIVALERMDDGIT